MSFEKNSDTIWYFAYGANMEPDVFIRDRRMHPISAEPAKLENFRLTFNLPGIPWIEPGFGNIERAPGKHVCGVLYMLHRNELARLDGHEGGKEGYKRIFVDVTGKKSGKVKAHVYRVPESGIGLKPSRRYLQTLIHGAEAHRLPSHWIEHLKNQESIHSPILSPMMNLFSPLIKLLYVTGIWKPFESWRKRQFEKGRKLRLQRSV